jgi:hypothetical protein
VKRASRPLLLLELSSSLLDRAEPCRYAALAR